MGGISNAISRFFGDGVSESDRYAAELDDAVRTNQRATDRVVLMSERSDEGNSRIEETTRKILMLASGGHHLTIGLRTAKAVLIRRV